MAESVISFLLKNLSQQLAHEANLLSGVEDDVTSLRDELKLIDAFLKYAERTKISNEIIDEVINQIKNAAQDSEDVIDTFLACVTMHRRRNILSRTIHGAGHAMMIRKVAGKIKQLKSKINEIHNNKLKYDFQGNESTRTGEDTQRWDSINRRRMNVEEDDVVGFFHDLSVVIQRLTEGGSHPRLTVVSIIGMGGLGKTTLARKIYNNNRVKNYFECCAWVYVSNDCRPRELLLNLLKFFTSISQDVYNLREDELKSKIRECLNGKRYFVVLDDIWKTQDWDSIKCVFPDNGINSRILITTRLKDVASYIGCTQPYHLPFLSAEESWELFRKKVFRGEHCPSDLEPLGRKIAKSCHGLPLSVVVLSGYLANKEKSFQEWSKIMGHVNWFLTQDQTQVNDIVLKLSYDNLPQRLIPCFLYFGVFPEDFEVHVRPLIEKWIAEGFIQECGTRNPEDVAEDYLYELIDRSLIQVASRRSDGRVKICRIHDLLRDLCLREGEKGKYFEVYTGTQRMTKSRRLAVHCSMPSYVSSRNFDHSCIRSLLDFSKSNDLTTEHWKWLVKSFKLVRVLDIGPLCVSRFIPHNLDTLIHLRYLRLHDGNGYASEVIPGGGYECRAIPDAICNLWNLETLDLSTSLMSHLVPRTTVVFPSRMWKLQRLRHLRSCHALILSDFSRSDTKIMWNLQNLSCVVLNKEATSLFQKGMVLNLRKLGLVINVMDDEQWQRLWKSLRRLTSLDKLKLYLPYQPLAGRVESVTFPSQITKLTLANFSCFSTDIMTNLANFTNLRILKLSCIEGDDSFDLKFFNGWFPQLQVFHMIFLPVRNWELANGAMPHLQCLVIDNCDCLPNLPSELWSLTTLKQVQILRPSNELAQMLQKLELRDGVKLTIQK